jgi:hypothetical protein
MKYPTRIFPKNIAKASLVATTFVIALASPAGAVSSSLSVSSSLDLFKNTVTSAIDSSITKLQASSKSLDSTLSLTVDKSGLNGSASNAAGSASGSVSSSGASGSVSTSNGSSASGSVSSSGATGSASTGSTSSDSSSSSNGNASSPVSSAITFNTGFLQGLLSIPKELIQKLQDSNKKAIEKLTALKTEVQATASVQDVQVKAKQFDVEFKEIATANVQASVTKTIDSETKVLDQLQVAANNIQTQVNKLKECIQGGSASASGSVSNTSANGSINASAPGCTSFNVDANSGDNGQSLQDQLDEIKSSLQTIRSFLSSSINLVGQLKDGNYSGTIKSFQGVDSQIDIVASLSSDAQNSLLNLSAAVNK